MDEPVEPLNVLTKRPLFTHFAQCNFQKVSEKRESSKPLCYVAKGK